MNISKKDMFWAWWPLASFLFIGLPIGVVFSLDKTENIWPAWAEVGVFTAFIWQAWAGVGVFTVFMTLFLIDLGFEEMEYVKTEKRKEISTQKELEK